MADSSPQGTPTQRSGDGGTPFSPPSSKRRRRTGRGSEQPLSSLPSNLQDSELPQLDSQATGSKQTGGRGGSRGTAAGGGRRAGTRSGARRAAAGGGGGGGGDSDHEMTDADGQPASGAGGRGRTGTTGLPSSGLAPTPGMERGTSERTPTLAGGATLRENVSSYIPTPSDAADPEGAQRIWGTHYSRREMEGMIRRFLTTFRAQDAPAGGEEGLATYTALLRQAMLDGHSAVNIDAAHVQQSSPRLLAATIEAPEDLLNFWDQQVNKLAAEQQDVLEQLGVPEPLERIQARIFNLAHVRAVRDLDPLDIDCLVAVRGMVTRTGNIIPDLRMATFRCDACGAEAHELVSRGVVATPGKCPSPQCGRKATMRLLPNRSAYVNRQIVKVQEDPSNIPEGETPRSLLLFAFDTNVDAVKPGDKVTITGVFRATKLRVNPRQRASHALFKTYLDITHIARDEGEAAFRAGAGAGGKGAEGGATQGATQEGLLAGGGGNLSRAALAEKEAAFRAMAADPEHYSKLIASVAPRVIDMDAVKAGLLAQLFGGVAKSTAAPGHGTSGGSGAEGEAGSGAPAASSAGAAGRGGRGTIRGDVNVLVVGDPSVSKSQLLGFVHAVAPRGIYTSGKGSSAVGLTAYVTRDPETNEMVLESGALVLSDRGICCIDEFDKMSDGARAMLHEVMEQQTVSVAKAGLVSQLNARTSILACANPKGSRYLPELSLAENINLPPTLLSRFDLVYLVLDRHDEERDRRLARHLVSLFWADAPEQQRPPYSIDLLREFVAFARARVTPALTPGAEARLVECYKELRRQCRDEKDGRVAATPRQLEAMIRISEALARMHLREEVTEADVRAAYRLWYDALSGSASDEEGRLDMNLLSSGTSAKAAAFLTHELPELLRGLLGDMFKARSSVSLSELYAAYMAAHAEQKKRAQQQQLAGGGADGQQQQQQQQQFRAISQAQLQMAVLQLTDLVNMRGGVLTRKGGEQQQQQRGGAEEQGAAAGGIEVA